MPKGLSLHIGLNEVDAAHYAGWSGPLNAGEADAEDLQALAERVGYETHVLKSQDATRKAVLDAIIAGTELKRGDIFLLTYAGHGGQLPDRNGDEPDDMLDETWCLFDGQLLDDELYALWSRFAPGVRLLVVSDSCHSGTVTRVGPPGEGRSPLTGATAEVHTENAIQTEACFRVAPRDVLLRTYRQNRALYDRVLDSVPVRVPEPLATVRLFSGCQDDQLSRDGTFNGLFTSVLLQVWNEGRFKGDYSAFHDDIVRRMPSEQSPKHFLIGRPSAQYDSERPFTIG